MGRPRKIEGHAIRYYLRIVDDNLWQYIDRLQTIDKYKNSFNKMVNEALDYGLPLLLKAEFGEVEELKDIPEAQAKTPTDIATERYYTEVVRLLKEVIVNVTINKSLLSSLFQAKAMELKGSKAPGDKFYGGLYNDTPECLVAYELRSLKGIRR